MLRDLVPQNLFGNVSFKIVKLRMESFEYQDSK